MTISRRDVLLQGSVIGAIKRLGDGARLLGFSLHAHQLRHACGFALANAGYDTHLIQDWLGHRSISSTVRYTELTARRFKDVHF
jgi:type 1 fimbriae regulatory protein FimE